MAETIPHGASFFIGNTKASQIGNNSEAIELQSVELNQEKSSNSPETELMNQEEVSHLKVKSLKKIATCRIIKILSLLALFGVIIFSIYHLSNTSVETKSPTTTYLVIWNKNSQPKVFETLEIVPMEDSEMNVIFDNIAIFEIAEYITGNIEVQENEKVSVVLNDQPLISSSPKQNINSSTNISTLIVTYEERNEFEEAIKDYDIRYPVHISKVFNSWLKKGRAGHSRLSFYHSNSELITSDWHRSSALLLFSGRLLFLRRVC